MIRINLLGVERTRPARRLRSTSASGSLAAGVIVAVAVLGIGWWYWTLSRESAQLDADLAAAQQEPLDSVASDGSAAVRGATRAAAAARRAHHPASQRTEHPSAAARPHQPQPSRHALAATMEQKEGK